jgi:hypothetical protein
MVKNIAFMVKEGLGIGVYLGFSDVCPLGRQFLIQGGIPA